MKPLIFSDELIPPKLRDLAFKYFGHTLYDKEDTFGNGAVFCKLCDKTVLSNTNRKDYDRTLSVREQQHLESETHLANVTLAKLANE
jgi:hypothetical protein